jgi:hypothetical protein
LGQLARKHLNQPTTAVEYNVFMGGVDQSDQRWAQYYTQLRTLRVWFSLFFWLLDTTLINIFLTAQQHVGGPKGSLYTTQREFQNIVVRGLIEEGFAVLEAEHKAAQKAREMAREEVDNAAMLMKEYLDPA